MATSDFVRVAPDGRSFTLRGSPFYFCGANCYYMMVRLELVRVTYELIPQLKSFGLHNPVLRGWPATPQASVVVQQAPC